MAEAKRSSRINELENDIRGLEFLLKQLKQVEENNVPAFLRETGYASKQEIESNLAKAIQSLCKAKGEQVETEEKMDASTADKYNLVNVPDNVLTPEQVCVPIPCVLTDLCLIVSVDFGIFYCTAISS